MPTICLHNRIRYMGGARERPSRTCRMCERRVTLYALYECPCGSVLCATCLIDASIADSLFLLGQHKIGAHTGFVALTLDLYLDTGD